MANEKLCLKWNDFQNIVQTSFGDLRSDSDFSDVTLACEDESIKAHKAILSACSPFFKKLLKTEAHPHPLIYMRGVKSEDLLAIVDFLYRGEANVFQENLDSFLAIAEELQLKGLMGKTDDKSRNLEEDEKPFSAFNAHAKIPKPSFRRQAPNAEFLRQKCTILKRTQQLPFQEIFWGFRRT